MKHVKISIVYSCLGYVLFMITVSVILLPVYFLGIKNEHFGLLATVLSLILLPLLDYYNSMIESRLSTHIDTNLYIETIDAILGLHSLDDFLKKRFDTILKMMSVKNGVLILLNKQNNEYNIYSSQGEKRRIIHNADIDSDNILFKITSSPDDVILKSKLNRFLNFEKKIHNEMNRFRGELSVPVFYRNIFLGLIILGDRKMSYSEEEITTLKILASKIGLLSINTFFWDQMIKKKELDKDNELGLKVQKRFLPPRVMKHENIHSAIFFRSASPIIDSFYDIFPYKKELRFTAYKIKEGINSPLIFMPAVKALLQTFVRLGFPAGKAVARMKETVRSRGLIDEELSIIHSSIDVKGNVSCCLEQYPNPYIFQSGRLTQSKEHNQNSLFSLSRGDLIFFTCSSLDERMQQCFSLVEQCLQQHKKDHITDILDQVMQIIATDSEPEDDIFLAVIRLEDY